MEFSIDQDDEAFRTEVREFIRENLPEGVRLRKVRGLAPRKEDVEVWTRTLHARGWSVPHWPEEWGGTGWKPPRLLAFREEMQKAAAPDPLSFGVSMVGPVIYTFGSREQQERFLPRIAKLEDWWCQGFSEPGAGSDLASLATRAERIGDRYVVNGQKTWTTYAQHADWMFCLVRTAQTARRQEGISFVLIDMRSPGVEVRPIRTIDGGHEINEVFLTDVEIPVSNLVGEENKGWSYAKFLLGHERTGIARIGTIKERLARIRDLAARSCFGAPLIDDARFRTRLAEIEVDVDALEMMMLNAVIGDPSKTQLLASMLKLRGSEIQQSISELALELVGPFAIHGVDGAAAGLAADEEPFSVGALVASNYFNLRKVTVFGGASEIQRSIIASRIMGQ